MTTFTVMIPTRERCETLRYTLASCIAQQHDQFEIIVSDNCSVDDTRAVVAQFTDPRIKYVNPGKRLSMTANFEFALSHATGDFVMFLGDDDGLMPNALTRVEEIIRSTGQQAVISSQALYHWPNSLDLPARNRLVFSTRSGVEVRQTREVLDRVLRFKTPFLELPGAYVGFIDRRIIDSARDAGVYFHSSTPDAYSALANSGLLQSYAYVHTPFAIAGLSGRSHGSSFLGGNDRAEATTFESENDRRPHADLVICPSYEVLMAEAFLQARDHVPALGGLSIDIAELCQVALCEAPPWSYQHIEAGVGDIRRKHGIVHVANGSKARGHALRSLARRYRRGLGRVRQRYRIVDCTDFEAYDVAAAARVALTITAFLQRGYGSRWSTLSRWLKRL
jgi:glycosyltransferase involved in cell wall biosynthesis